MKCALVQDFQVVDIQVLSEAEYLESAKVFQIVVNIEGTVPEPVKGWAFDGNKFLPPIGTDAAELVCLNVYDPLVVKLNKVRRRFIGENIAWGITQAGKTRAVGDFMKDVELWFGRSSVYEVVQEIEKCKIALQNDSTLAASLAPFVTISRLDSYKFNVLQAAGLA